MLSVNSLPQSRFHPKHPARTLQTSLFLGALDQPYRPTASDQHPGKRNPEVCSAIFTFLRQIAQDYFSDSEVHDAVERCSHTMTVLRRALQLNARKAFRLPHRNVSSKKDEPIDIPTSLWHQRLGPVTSFFTWFHRTQQKRPLTVQVCTSLTVYLCGDLLAQEIGGEKYDSTRTLRMLTIGAVASIPGYKW